MPFIISESNFNLGFEKFISSTHCKGIKWICAWGTSNPITATPTRLQGMVFSIAFAIFFANCHKPLYSVSLISKMESVSFLGITKTWPTASGKISKNAK